MVRLDASDDDVRSIERAECCLHLFGVGGEADLLDDPAILGGGLEDGINGPAKATHPSVP
jgi:hypothetical protein